jgi:hypothetical protein
MNDVDEVTQVAAQAVRFPNDEGVPSTQGFHGSVESGPRVEVAGGVVLVESTRGNASVPCHNRNTYGPRLSLWLTPVYRPFATQPLTEKWNPIVQRWSAPVSKRYRP